MTASRRHVGHREVRRLIRDASLKGLLSERALRTQLEESARGIAVAGGRLVRCGIRHFLLRSPRCTCTNGGRQYPDLSCTRCRGTGCLS